MREKISVFVSSDMTELEYERETAKDVISDLSLEARLFEVELAQSRSPSQAYLEGVGKCQIFALIVWQSFSKPVEEEYNLALDQAKPILIFVKNLQGKEERSPNLKNLLDQLTGGKQAQSAIRTTYRAYRRLSDFRAFLRDSLIHEIAKFYEVPRVTMTRSELYEVGTDIVKNAQRRLYVVQRTPTLFLGSRNYLDPADEKVVYEETFREELQEWIECGTKKQKRELLYLFSPVSMCHELSSLARMTRRGGNQVAAYKVRVAKAIKRYKEIERKSGRRLRFLPLTSQFSGPMIVGDNRFAIWILGTDMAVSLSQENDAMAAQLGRLLEASVKEDVAPDEILTQVGLRKSR